MKQISLTQGYFTEVDDEDFEWLNQWKWCTKICRKNIYAVRATINEHGKKSTQRMHRLIMGVTNPKVQVDHRKGVGLNNTRENLRLCTNAQNSRNRGGNDGSSSLFKGVNWNKVSGSWCAHITIGGKKKYLGAFKNEELAARAYDEAALKGFGDFARLNFPNK